MTDLSGDLHSQIKDILSKYEQFERDDTLKTIFVDVRIALWKNKLSNATSKDERIDLTIAYLLDKYNKQGENGLTLLLQVLRDRTHQNDLLYQEIGDLLKKLNPQKKSRPSDHERGEPETPKKHLPADISVLIITVVTLSLVCILILVAVNLISDFSQKLIAATSTVTEEDATTVVAFSATSTAMPTSSSPTVTLTPIPLPTTPKDTPITTPPPPQGKLAIPLQVGMGHRVYITGLDGKGINGSSPISLDARQPVFSPDGASIMVNGRVSGVLGLFQLTSSGFSPGIVINRESAAWPVISPDGSEVLFTETALDYSLHRRYSDEGDNKIEEIRLNGRPISAKNLLWTEDNRLVFQGCADWLDRADDCGTWVTDASNLDPKKLLDGNGDWPMNAKRGLLAYQTAADGDWDIYVMPLDGNTEGVNVTDNDAQDGLPAISPDGNYIAYISNQSGAWAVWTVDLNSLTKTKLFDINSERGTVTPETWIEERMSWAW